MKKTRVRASKLNIIPLNNIRFAHSLPPCSIKNAPRFARRRADQMTSSKATKNLAKTEKAIIAKVHEQEIEVSNINNELARIKVDGLNTEAHNVQLRDKMEKCKQELIDKDKLIEKYQMEIRQRNDEIEKKMYRVDRLNRKYEKMTEGVEEVEAMGPLEASIKNINKEIDKEVSERSGAERVGGVDEDEKYIGEPLLN